MGNAFSFAAQMLSALPSLALAPPTRADARRSVALFPLIGALMGLLAACAWNLAAWLWNGTPLIAAAVVLAAGTALTGGRSLDGLARMVDGMAAHGAGGDRSRAFAVMRDPRRGTAGLVAVVVGAGLHLAFLSGLPASLSWGGLVLASALGRWATAFGLTAFPLALASTGEAEAARGLADAGSQEFLLATVLAIGIAAVLPVRGLLVLVGVALVVALLAATLNQRLGGFSLPLAHALGAVGEITALAFLALHIS